MKSPQEEIDRLVRERLLESNQTSGDWDMPSEKVWGDISQRIREKRRWRGAIWWVSVGIIVVISIALFLLSINERKTETVQSITNTTSPVVETTPAEPAKQGGEAPQIAVKQEDGGQPAAGQPLAENRGNEGSGGRRGSRGNGGSGGNEEGGDRGNRGSSVKPGDNHTLTENELQTEAFTATRTSSDAQNNPTSKTEPDLNLMTSNQAQREKTITSIANGSSENNSESAINPIIPSVLQTSRALVSIPFLKSDPGVQYTAERKLPIIAKPAVMIPVAKPSAWSLAFLMSPSMGTRRIVVPDAQPRVRRNLLLQQEEPAVQLGFGISAARELNPNWSVTGGIEYNRFLLNSTTRHQFRYSRIGERVNDRGNFENNYRLNLNTSYGEVSTDVIIERSSDAQMSEHQFINLSLQTRQSMQVLEFPVSLKYTLPMKGLHLSCYGGLSANVLLENALEFRTVQTQNAEVLQTRVARKAPVSGFRDFALGYQFGIGLEMPLQRQWSLFAGPSISGYLQPVYENRQVVIYPVTFDLQIGVRYQL